MMAHTLLSRRCRRLRSPWVLSARRRPTPRGAFATAAGTLKMSCPRRRFKTIIVAAPSPDSSLREAADARSRVDLPRLQNPVFARVVTGFKPTVQGALLAGSDVVSVSRLNSMASPKNDLSAKWAPYSGITGFLSCSSFVVSARAAVAARGTIIYLSQLTFTPR